MPFLATSLYSGARRVTISTLLIVFISLVYLYRTQPYILRSFPLGLNFTEQPHKTPVSNLRWCTKNPFLARYDKQLISNFEEKLYGWIQSHLSHTFDFLKRYVESPDTTLGKFIEIIYPTTAVLPCPYNNNTMKRYGNSRDAGKWLCGLETLSLNDTCIVYSLGSNNNFLFEESILLETLCTVHTFDCTSSPPKEMRDRLHFHKTCLGENSPLQHYIYPHSPRPRLNQSKPLENFLRFDQIVKIQNHSRVHVLKMDIEGGEYSVFADLLRNTSRPDLPYQISFESHWWNRDIYHAILHMSTFAQLWKSGYRLLQYELNAGDHSCIEWTFMRMFC